MKTKMQIFLSIILILSCNAVIAQNLDSMPVAKRDSILISISKEVILKYGPDYYREYLKPIIEGSTVPMKGEINPSGVNAGRVSYKVTFLYDKTEETLAWDYAAKVAIWSDTWQPSGVDFGNGIGVGISEEADWRKVASAPIPYRESVVPLYDYLDPNPNKKPKNLDELVRKGYVEQSNGQWVKTTPDVPPTRRNR